MQDYTTVIYYMKDAVFVAADALGGTNAGGACDAAVAALLRGWFAKQNEPVAVLADGLPVPVLAHSEKQLEDYAQRLAYHDGPCFAVAALSGTAAYERGLRDYCVAVAYLENRELKAAMVYDPAHAELFHAVQNLGAYLNGKSIKASGRKSLMEAYLSVDHGTLRMGKEEALRGLIMQAQHVRCGAPFSLALCYAACGRIDAAVGRGQSFIDSAAGLLIAKEAGAKLLNEDGNPLAPFDQIGQRISAAAACPGIAKELGEIIAGL